MTAAAQTESVDYRRRLKCQRTLAVLAAFGLVVSGSWAADLWLSALSDLAPDWPAQGGVAAWLRALPASFAVEGTPAAWRAALGLVLLGVFFFASLVLYRLRGSIIASRAVISGQQGKPPVSVLVVMLSSSNLPFDGAAAPGAAALEAAVERLNRRDEARFDELVAATWPREGGPWPEDAERPGNHWNWQQLVRIAVAHRQSSLKAVIVITSTGPRGSAGQFDRCARLLRAALPGCAIERHHTAISFEDYNHIYAAVGEAVDRAADRWGTPAARVCVDVTGGQTTSSIAAAVAAVNRGCVYSYVQTNPPYESLFYEARIEVMGS
jgi:hypothetical protein